MATSKKAVTPPTPQPVKAVVTPPTPEVPKVVEAPVKKPEAVMGTLYNPSSMKVELTVNDKVVIVPAKGKISIEATTKIPIQTQLIWL